ncbi:MAG TPA: P-II family nitrogen regulator [Bryobacteraceae bacterium]|nr:P-II family nitrogen regulator [Bryobacteraceae bacterium]
MKLIVALIRPETLLAVQDALAEVSEQVPTRLASVAEVSDLRRPEANVYRGSQYRKTRTRLRLEIMVEVDSAVDRVIEAILRGSGAGLGRSGDDIFVMRVDDWRLAAVRTTAAAAQS